MDEKSRRKKLREQYDARHPDMGIVCWKCNQDMWVGMSKDIRSTYNGTKFQLELDSWPNKSLQAAFNRNPDAMEWLVLKELDYDNPLDDHEDDLELLLLEVQEEYPAAQLLSRRRFV